MTILIVDDNEKDLYQLQVLLGASGYQAVTAVNGAEALAKARQDPPDLIISDILMPVMDGFALCREWKNDERLRPIPFVFYTATYSDERDREFALGLGAERFLIKPEEPKLLLGTIREALQPTASAPLVPSPPAAGRPGHVSLEWSPPEEAVYLKQYNEVLIRKLEAKMEQLARANLELERDITERKRAEAARERIVVELQGALARVKTLSGLLPICAGCKKIRDGAGYWSQVETYIQKHSEATFTHGYCPECIKKYYPELDDPVPEPTTPGTPPKQIPPEKLPP